jgi:hypothetical protein
LLFVEQLEVIEVEFEIFQTDSEPYCSIENKLS